MNLALDIVERVPALVLLGTGVGAAVVSLLVAGLFGGGVAVVSLTLGVLVVLVSGGLLAARVHLQRLPLELARVALSGRIDGHDAFRFRARLGRGRRMRDVRAAVRFLPEQGEPIELEALVPEVPALIGAWTLVVIDREDRCGGAGVFEVQIQVDERGKHLTASQSYPRADIAPGRFLPPGVLRKGRFFLEHRRWSEAARPALEDSEPLG